ncbi:MAG: hypothetical protein WD716_07080 [Fimbriimonadaceae bacterium]
MQQFVRRQPSDGGEPPREVLPSDSAMAQLLDQVTEISQQVARLREEVGTVKGENERLRSQMAEWIAEHERRNFGGAPPPLAPPVVVTAEPQAKSVEAPAPVPQPKLDHEDVNEDALIEQLRGAGLEESGTPVRAEEEAPAVSGPLSDEEIQKMLAQAALGAIDAAKAEEPEVAVEELEPEVAVAEGPVLRIEEAAPEFAQAVAIEFDRAAVAKVPSHLAIGALAIPVSIADGTILCKAVAPLDRASLDMIADATACKVTAETAPTEDVLAALRKAYGDESDDLEREAVWNSANQKPQKRGLFGRAS